MSARQEEKKYEVLSPFELKNKLISMARTRDEKTMLNAFMTADRAAEPAFESINVAVRAKRVEPAVLQWANNHDPRDTPGTGSSNGGGSGTAAANNGPPQARKPRRPGSPRQARLLLSSRLAKSGSSKSPRGPTKHRILSAQR